MRPTPIKNAPDADWIAGLYDAHGERLFGYALMILADRAAAEDAVQEVFSMLLERPRLRDGIRSPADYLRRAVRNECYSVLRRRRASPMGDSDGLVAARKGSAPDPDQQLALSRAIAGLSADQREVLHLKAFEGLTFAEIASAVGIPANTAASRYRYAVAHLREALSADRAGDT
jgi:RNA polymerase sigma-70 factor (ECF subfamily)